MLEYSAKAQDLLSRLSQFMDEHIYPNEATYAEQLEAMEKARGMARRSRGAGTMAS